MRARKVFIIYLQNLVSWIIGSCSAEILTQRTQLEDIPRALQKNEIVGHHMSYVLHVAY